MLLRLPHSVKDLFSGWLEQNYPWRKKRVLNRIRQMRGGKLSDHRFHVGMKGTGEYARQIRMLFKSSCEKTGLSREDTKLSTQAFRGHPQSQLVLFA
jgi:DNA repair photolyase